MNNSVSSVNFAAKARLPKVKSFKTEVVKKNELPDFFRDRELFDPAKDKVTDEYSQYDVDDLPIFSVWG